MFVRFLLSILNFKKILIMKVRLEITENLESAENLKKNVKNKQ